MLSRFSLFGVGINIMDLQGAVAFLSGYDYTKKGYICMPDTYVIAHAADNDALRKILNQSLLTLPDGKPIELYARAKGVRGIATVSGYWLMKALLNPGIRHFFYGAEQETLQKMSETIKRDYPDAEIVGFRSPPFLIPEEIADHQTVNSDFAEINTLAPDIIWIGISSPKQDILMASYQNKLGKGIMIGVGGVFDYFAGKTRISPEWIKRIGFRWLFRLVQEPRRLWKKYLFGISRFMYLVIKELISVSVHGKRVKEPVDMI